MKKLVLGGLVLAASLAFAPLAFADVAPVDPQVVAVKTQVACGTVTVTLTNNDVGAYGFDWHTVPWNGGDAGVKSGSITVAAGATVTQTIRLAEDSYDGKGAFTMGVVFGPNTFKQPFLDLGLVNTDCAPPVEPTVAPTTDPTVAPTTTPAPTTVPKADKDCVDFPTKEAAQAFLDADKTDPSRLDANHNGIACEDPADEDPTDPPLPTILPVPVSDTTTPQVDVIPSAIDTGRA